MYGVYSRQVNIMLLPSQKPSSSYSLLKFAYVTSQLHHPLEVYPLEVYSFLRKILDSPLTRKPDTQVRKKSGQGLTKRFFQSQFLFVADKTPISGHLTITVATKDQRTILVSSQLYLRTPFSCPDGVCL